jgi:hypothetical protein
MEKSAYRDIRDSLQRLYLDDPRPWLVGYSGGKAESDGAELDETPHAVLPWQTPSSANSTMLASLVFDAAVEHDEM